MKTNVGFARGEWFTLLNTSAYPEPDWLENLLQAANRNPGCSAFSSRQIQYHVSHLLDGAGDNYHISRLAWCKASNLPVEANGLTKKEIFSSCDAAAHYRRKEFLPLGGFDEDYFSGTARAIR
ncbi:MAG: hypothetical protein HND47_23090 [Chloroflexi bacterium]|nr:hypothetical protein [Chloroflexota bacterium]